MRMLKIIQVMGLISLFLSYSTTKISLGLSKPTTGVVSAASTFLYSNLTVNPGLVNAGDDVEVSVMIKNVGDLIGSTNSSLTLNGSLKQSKALTLGVGENITLIFTLDTKNLEGNYEVKVNGIVGELTVVVQPLPHTSVKYSEFIISPTEVKPGEPITVSLKVNNIGEVSGLYNVILSIDGVTKSTRTGVLLPNASALVTFNVSNWDLGTHLVEASNFSGNFTVVNPTQPNYPLYILVGVEVAIILASAILLIRRRSKK